MQTTIMTFSTVPKGMPSVDVHVPMGGVARYRRRSIEGFPQHQGYLSVDMPLSKRLRACYQQRRKKPVIGISWWTKAAKKGPKRSIDLAWLAPLTRRSDVEVVSLQYGDHMEDLEACEGVVTVDKSIDQWQDLDGFAAQVAAMDVVLSIDNATVHMAGALNVPVITLLPKAADWRWLQGTSTSPWYPSMQLLRQQEMGNWQALQSAAMHAVDNVLAGKKT
jgi:ADP-heptose:LPS heptosyltransferase